MNIIIPPALQHMAPEITEFFEAMLHKLHVNAHKQAIRDDDIDGLLDKMEAEIQEFRDQRLQDAEDPNILEETADSANFAFLLYAFLRSRGVRTMRERFIDEFFHVDTDKGKVFCKKTRSGSPLKVGDPVGSYRNGQCFIRTQHAITGATISVPRCDLVWWARHGSWPRQKLRHKNGHKEDDRLVNLEETPESEPKDGKYPFVSRYCPKGREHTANYGKFVYQRRHAFELVRVGYWDTEEEAAREGLKAWKERIRGKNNA